MKLSFRGRTDVGKTREHNEDDYGYGEGADVERYGELLVVCDGMGGHASGEVASHLGVETVIAAYYEDPAEDRAQVLKRAFELANARIHTEGRGTMGTTGVAALLHQDALHIANVGDSRAYLVRSGAIRQISRDHSLVSEQVAAGIITAEQARSLYYRNVITRALGYQAEVAVDLFRLPLQPGDAVVLCSDGLHGLVSDEEIGAVAGGDALDRAVDHLVDLANERGGSDNITVLIARVDALGAGAAPEPPGDHVTVELPAEALAEAPAEPDASQWAPVAMAASAPPRPAPRERRLGLAGLLLSAALLLALGALIFFMLPGPVSAPGATATAAPTAALAATRPPATRPPATAAPTRAAASPTPARPTPTP